ncbi:nhaA, partial [Symbiodinium necroappetens]
PSLALARLSKKETMVCFEDDDGGGETRFAAVVICDRTSATQGQALARLIATTFMDEEFVSVARSAPKSPLILGALDAHLAQLTIVPTVKLNKAAKRASGTSSPKGDYLLSHSLVSGIQRRMSLVSPEQANLQAQEARRNSDASKESVDEVVPPTSYFIEVDR